ncbi:MAG TPA: TetR/AcrR family transcriptional regulator [Burkholderiales bacterium]|nr:TetR/AcrR family transcriptional regulator [Burkholderiales bacterium]
MPRLTRAAKKELTTSQLLDTARAIFLERGYHRATLDEIAEAAGLTKGAVYSRYGSKDELFLALLDQRYADISQVFAEGMAKSASFAEWLRREARRVMAQRRKEGDWYLLLLEFWTHAARDPQLRRAVAERHNRVVQLLADGFTQAKDKFGLNFEWPATKLARVGNAMLIGYTLERVLDPSSVPESLIDSMFELLPLKAVERPARGVPRAPVKRGNGARKRRKDDDASIHASRIDN